MRGSVRLERRSALEKPVEVVNQVLILANRIGYREGIKCQDFCTNVHESAQSSERARNEGQRHWSPVIDTRQRTSSAWLQEEAGHRLRLGRWSQRSARPSPTRLG